MARTPSTAIPRPSVDALNAGLFPDNAGQSHTFVVESTAGAQRTVTITPAFIATDPVPDWTVFNTPTGDVGYILFNDHIATAEGWLYDAINDMAEAEVSDLIIDMRYNGGGYLDIASELAYMVGNTTLTNGQTFEKTGVQREVSVDQPGDRPDHRANAVPLDDRRASTRRCRRTLRCRRST